MEMQVGLKLKFSLLKTAIEINNKKDINKYIKEIDNLLEWYY
jgi:hypothetical protein